MCTAYNFLDFNIFQGVSLFYGVHSIFWYFYAAAPFMLSGWLPFFLLGSWMAYGRTFFRGFIIAGILSHSWMAHKEFRFVYPLLPAMLVYIGHGMNIFVSKASKLSRVHKYSLIFGCVLINIGIAVFINQWHCVGPIHTVHYLNNKLGLLSSEQQKTIRLFWLTPCHASPYYSSIHYPIHMDFLHCEPPIEPYISKEHRYPKSALKNLTLNDYRREDISFFEDFEVNLLRLMKSEPAPNILVFYDDLLQKYNSQFRTFLEANNFVLIFKAFNCVWFPEGPRDNMLVYKKRTLYL